MAVLYKLSHLASFVSDSGDFKYSNIMADYEYKLLVVPYVYIVHQITELFAALCSHNNILLKYMRVACVEILKCFCKQQRIKNIIMSVCLKNKQLKTKTSIYRSF